MKIFCQNCGEWIKNYDGKYKECINCGEELKLTDKENKKLKEEREEKEYYEILLKMLLGG